MGINPITALLYALGALSVMFAAAWGRAIAGVRRESKGPATPATDVRFPTPFQLAIGFAHARGRHHTCRHFLMTQCRLTAKYDRLSYAGKAQ